MAQKKDDFGLSCTRWMPLAWRAQDKDSITDVRAAWLNQANEKRLRTLLERESRSNTSPEIAGLEALIIEVLHNVKKVPDSRSVLLSAHQMKWVEPPSSKLKVVVGECGIVRFCLDPELPYEVEFFCDVREVSGGDNGQQITVSLSMRSDLVIELYEQLVFIYYRRAQRDSKPAASHQGP